MKKTKVTIPWEQGLHARVASKLVHTSNRYRSTIRIRAKGKIADAKSIISILLLCATVGTLLEVEISGDDESYATAAIERFFETGFDADDAPHDSLSENRDRL